MNLPFEITLLWERLASPAGYRLSLSLIHFLWQGVVIALVAALFIRVLGRGSPHRRYAIGLAGLLAMAIAPVATFFLITPPAPPPEVTFTDPAIPATAALDASEIPPDDLTNEIHRLDALIQHLESELDEPTTLSAQFPSEPRSWFDILREWQPYLLLLWLAGTSLCALRLAIGAQASWRYRLGRKPLPEAARETLINLAQRLGVKPPRVFVSERVLEAIVVGLFRPMILLPAAWIGRIPPELLEAVLAHEIAHLRRHDLWINLAQRLLETLLFYHPALWWLSRRVRLEREFCCDEIAAQALDCRAAYARALEFVAAERLLASRLATLDTALVAGMGGDEMALLNRVRRVLGRDPLPGRFRWRWATGGALLLPFCLWGVFLWADTFWANSFAWAGGEGKPPVEAEQPAEASDLAAEATLVESKPDFEEVTGTSLLDEDIVVAVVCRASGGWAWDESGWNYDIMQSVSNRLYQHGITVRRPEQIRAWSDEHPKWDRPSDVGAGVEATHVIMIRPTSFHLSTKGHGRASADVQVVAEQPDGDWHLTYEKEIHTDRLGAENPFSATTQRFWDPLSDQVARLFYEPDGDNSIDIEADPFGLPAPPDGDPSSEDPFADLQAEVPFAEAAEGVGPVERIERQDDPTQSPATTSAFFAPIELRTKPADAAPKQSTRTVTPNYPDMNFVDRTHLLRQLLQCYGELEFLNDYLAEDHPDLFTKRNQIEQLQQQITKLLKTHPARGKNNVKSQNALEFEERYKQFLERQARHLAGKRLDYARTDGGDLQSIESMLLIVLDELIARQGFDFLETHAIFFTPENLQGTLDVGKHEIRIERIEGTNQYAVRYYHPENDSVHTQLEEQSTLADALRQISKMKERNGFESHPAATAPAEQPDKEHKNESNKSDDAKTALPAPKEVNDELKTLREEYEKVLTKQLEALKKQREKVNNLIERGATTPDAIIEVDKQIVEVMWKLLELKTERTASREPVLRPKVSPVERLWAPIDPIEAQGPAPDAAIEPQAPPIPDNEDSWRVGPPAGPRRATPAGPLMAPGEFKVTMSRDGNVAIVVFHDAAFGAEITYSVPAEKLAALLEKLSKQTKSKPVPLPDGEIRWGDPQITLPMKGPASAVPSYENPSADDGFSEPPSEENSDDRPLGSPPDEGFQPPPSETKPNLYKRQSSPPPATFE